MVKRRKKAKAKKTARIYYNEPGMEPLWWTVEVSDATRPVKAESTLADALKGVPGCTIGCHLSNTVKRNSSRFPHPVILAAVTKNAMLVVDRFKKGEPCHAWRYVHHMGKLVDLNDTDKTKRVIKAMPKLAERELTFHPPHKRYARPQSEGVRPRGNLPGNVGNVVGPKSPRVVKGALQRAVKAGLIAAPVARALRAA